MKLPLDARILGIASIDEVPVPSRAAVVSPAWNRGVVGQDCIKGDVGLVVVVKVSRPIVDLFLTGGIPRHFTAEGIGLALPSVGAFLHYGLELRSLIRPSLIFQILKQPKKNSAFHLAIATVIRCLRTHCERGLIGLVEIPLPRVPRRDSLCIAGDIV